MKGDEDEEAADLARGLAGFGTESLADGTDDGADDTAAAGRVGGDEGGEDEVGERDGIAKVSGVLPNSLMKRYATRRPTLVWVMAREKRNAVKMSQTVGSAKPARTLAAGRVRVRTSAVMVARTVAPMGMGWETRAMMVATKKATRCRWDGSRLGEDEIDEEPGYQGGGPAPGSIGSVHVVNAILSYALRLAIGEDFVTVAGE